MWWLWLFSVAGLVFWAWGQRSEWAQSSLSGQFRIPIFYWSHDGSYYGHKVDCLLQCCTLNAYLLRPSTPIFVPRGAAVWEEYGTSTRWGFPLRSGPLQVGLETLQQGPSSCLVPLLLECGCDVTSRPPSLPQPLGLPCLLPCLPRSGVLKSSGTVS